MGLGERECNFARFEQQVFALFGRRGIDQLPEFLLSSLWIAGREADQCQPAALPSVFLRVAATSLLIGGERPTVVAAEKPRVAEVVMSEHELRSERDNACERLLGCLEPPTLALDDADVVEERGVIRIALERAGKRCGGTFGVVELAKCRPEIAEGGGETGHEGGGTPERIARLRHVVGSEP